MRNILALERTKTILISLIMIAFGVLFIALPQSSYEVLIKVLAWILIGFGALLLLHFFFNFKFLQSSSSFVTGLLVLLLGLLLLKFPELYIYAIGLFLIFSGIQYVGFSLDQKRLTLLDWWKDLIYGITEFLLGAVLLLLIAFNAATTAVMIYLGVSLIVDGLFILIGMFVLKHEFKKLVK